VFQTYHLFPTLTAEENIRIALDVCGEPRAIQREKAEAALAAVGLADKAEAFPSELSSGQQQRVAIARALAGNPSAILADEPTAALDSSNGRAIMGLLAQIARDPSHTVLVVTHDPRILEFADRIVHLEDGRILKEEWNKSERAVA
jgi:putative ABC transport system ATP-binding protein